MKKNFNHQQTKETNKKIYEINYSDLSDKKIMEKNHLTKSHLGFYTNFLIGNLYHRKNKYGISECAFYESVNNLFVINKIFNVTEEDYRKIERLLCKLINIIYFEIFNDKVKKLFTKDNLIAKQTISYLNKGLRTRCSKYLSKNGKKVKTANDLLKRILYVCAAMRQNEIAENITNEAVKELMEVIEKLNQYPTIYGTPLFSDSIFIVQKIETVSMPNYKSSYKKAKKVQEVQVIHENDDKDNVVKNALVELLLEVMKRYIIFESVLDEFIPFDADIIRLKTHQLFINPNEYSVLIDVIYAMINVDATTKNLFQFGPLKDDMLAVNKEVQTEIYIRSYYDKKNNLIKTEQVEYPISHMKTTTRKISGITRMSDRRAVSPENMNLYFTPNESSKVNEMIQYGFHSFASVKEKRGNDYMQRLNALYVDIDLEKNKQGNMRSKKALESAKRRVLDKLEELDLFITISETMHGFHIVLPMNEDISEDIWNILEDGFIDYLEKNGINGIDKNAKDNSRLIRAYFSIQTEAPQDFDFNPQCNKQVRPVQVSCRKYDAQTLKDMFIVKEEIKVKENDCNDEYGYHKEGIDEFTIESVPSKKSPSEKSLSEKSLSKNESESITKIVKKSIKQTMKKSAKEQSGLVFSILNHVTKLQFTNTKGEKERLIIPNDDETYVNYYPDFTNFVNKVKQYAAEDDSCHIVPLNKKSIKPCVCKNLQEAKELITHVNCFVDIGLHEGTLHDVFGNDDKHPSANVYCNKNGRHYYKDFRLNIPQLDFIAFIAIILNLTYEQAFGFIRLAYGIRVLSEEEKEISELVLKAEVAISKTKAIVLNAFNKFKLIKQMPFVRAFFDSVLLAYTNIVNHNENYEGDIFNTIFSFTWKYFKEYLEKNTNIIVNRSNVKTFIRMMEFMGIIVKVDPQGMNDSRIQHLNHILGGIKYGQSFPSMYYLKDITAEELEFDMKELQGIVGEKLSFSKYDTHEKIKAAFPEKYVNRVIISSNQWKNRTVSISKKDETSEGFSIVSFAHPFVGMYKNSYKKYKKIDSNEQLNEWLKGHNLMEKDVYTQIDIFNMPSMNMKVRDVLGKNEHVCVPVNTLVYKETPEGLKVNNVYSINTIIIHISGERTIQKDTILSWLNPISIIYTTGEKSGYYLMFKFDRVMSGKKSKGFETFVRFNVYKMLMSYHHIFKTGISLNKSESMTAIPVPYTKKIGKQYETEIVYFNLNNIKNYIFYTIGNTDCHQLKDIRMIERTYTKIATLKSSFHKKFKNRIISDEERSLLHREIYASFEAISR